MAGVTLIDALLALAPLVVVPLGVRVARLPVHAAVLAVGALAATVAILLPTGPAAVLLAGVWVLATAVVGIAALTTVDIVRIVACGYLAFGAVWLVLDRAAVAPMGFSPVIVELTAVHYHYAGFAAAVIAWCAGSRIATTFVLAGPPITAIGFAYVPLLQVVGAVVITAGLVGVGWRTVRGVVPALADRRARGLLVASSLAVLVPMVLAAQWAAGSVWGTPALSIPAMAGTHGVTNAVGFSLLGLWGWYRAARYGSAP